MPDKKGNYKPENQVDIKTFQHLHTVFYCRHTEKHTYTHTYMHTCIHTYIDTYIQTDRQTE